MLAVLSDYGNRICRDEAGEFVDPEDAGVRDIRYFRVAPGLYAVRVSFDRRSLF